MIEYKIDHIPRTTPNNRRPGIRMNWEHITIHNTGNPNSTALNERGWLTNPSNTKTASYHIVVDEFRAVECIPLTEVAWHAGDGNGKGNRASIGIELCESGNFQKTLENAAKLVAKSLVEKGKSIQAVKQHFDWNGKNCPRLLRQGDRWQQFLKMIEKELDAMKLADWQRDGGRNAIDELVSEGVINDPDTWKKEEELSKGIPAWLFWIVLAKTLRVLRRKK